MRLLLEDLSGEKRKAVEELRMRVKDILTPDLYKDILIFYRFLEAREFRINDAEDMLRNHIMLRKVYQVDTISEDLKPKEFFIKYVEPSILGFDKEGSLVVYLPIGKIISKDMYKCEKKHNLKKLYIQYGEKLKYLQIKENQESGRNATQVIFIADLDQLSWENTFSKETADFLVTAASVYQDNYPEYLKAVYIINAPSYYVAGLMIIKYIVSNKTKEKLLPFGYSGWKEKLLEVIDADTLPAFLGGNRTDPDGNPLCKTSVTFGGKIPSLYYLSDEERYFKDISKVNKVIIPKMDKKEIHINVNAVGTLIQWEFFCKGNIGFGILHEDSGRKLKDVIPIAKYNTSDGTEKYSYKTRLTGKYIIVFDNTFSRLTRKEVEYCIDVINPE